MENLENTVQDTGKGNDFMGKKKKSTGSQAKPKVNKSNYIKLRSFCTTKNIVNEMQRNPSEGEKHSLKYWQTTQQRTYIQDLQEIPETQQQNKQPS